MLDLRREFADVIDIQVVAFPSQVEHGVEAGETLRRIELGMGTDVRAAEADQALDHPARTRLYVLARERGFERRRDRDHGDHLEEQHVLWLLPPSLHGAGRRRRTDP